LLLPDGDHLFEAVYITEPVRCQLPEQIAVPVQGPYLKNAMSSSNERKIIDAHCHLYDRTENRHEFLENVDEMFEALIGDYSALPRRYLLDEYIADQAGLQVVGLVWHEFMSSDPVREVRWAQRMAENSRLPISIVGLVDFFAPDLEGRLDAYTQCQNVVGVREHLGWDDENPLRRFAKRPDLLTDSRWLHGLKLLARYRFKCSLEVFSSQLPDLLKAVRLNPDIGFTIAVMGWPRKTDELEFTRWKQSLAGLSACENVRIVISAIECIFGMTWSLPEVQRWVQTVLELFGAERTMFGSHRPICGLSSSFPTPYAAYEKMTKCLSPSERDAVFRLNAADWFFSGLQTSKGMKS
jgi:predicted TIM-barrel fold metal-dependent hydrolase